MCWYLQEGNFPDTGSIWCLRQCARDLPAKQEFDKFPLHFCPNLPRSLSWVGVGARLSLLLPCRILLNFHSKFKLSRSWEEEIARCKHCKMYATIDFTSPYQDNQLIMPPGNWMWRGGVVGAIQGAILAPLTLVDHALPLHLPILGLSAGELSGR